MPSIFITGANRGIGLALSRLAASLGHDVYAACRNPDGARDLWEVERDFPGTFQIVPLDVTSNKLVSPLPAEVKIDILINNAGILEEWGEGLLTASIPLIEKSFQVNTLGPLRVIRALWPHLAKKPLLVQMSSRVGSIGDNSSGLAYGYRLSKAALNMLTVNLSIEMPHAIVVSLHPGWVKTEMGGAGATVEIIDSARGLMALILGLKPTDSGRFLGIDGAEIPW